MCRDSLTAATSPVTVIIGGFLADPNGELLRPISFRSNRVAKTTALSKNKPQKKSASLSPWDGSRWAAQDCDRRVFRILSPMIRTGQKTIEISLPKDLGVFVWRFGLRGEEPVIWDGLPEGVALLPDGADQFQCSSCQMVGFFPTLLIIRCFARAVWLEQSPDCQQPRSWRQRVQR